MARNLPNIPLPTTKSLVDGQISSTFIGDRTADRVPVHVSQALLDLHYICLYQARVMRLIKSSGAILSSMGGRVPVQSMLDMADAAGYSSRVVSLTWKIQSEPETVIGEYAENQKKGLGKVGRSYPPRFFIILMTGYSTISTQHQPWGRLLAIYPRLLQAFVLHRSNRTCTLIAWMP